MDRKAEQHLERLLSCIRNTFTNVEVKNFDVSEKRAILEVRCNYGDKIIAVTEILMPNVRKYSYYLIKKEGKVLLGLDNAADRRALRLKYGRDFAQHIHEPVPHRHATDQVELTEEMTFADFVAIVTVEDKV